MTLAMKQRDCIENPAAYCQSTFDALLAKGLYSVKANKNTRLNRYSDVAIAMMLLNSTKTKPCLTSNDNAESCKPSNAKANETAKANDSANANFTAKANDSPVQSL